jgi:hypothetical protein
VDIEHYVAKTVDANQAFEWNNLLPACRLCHEKKGDLDHGGALLKPDAEDPEPYFWLAPNGEIQPHPSLDYDAASKRRAERIEEIGLLLDHPSRERVEFLLAPRRQFKFVIRQVLEQRGQAGTAAEDRRRFEAPPP